MAPQQGDHDTTSPSPLPASAFPAVTAAQMAEADRLAVGRYGVELLAMMELAGSHLAEVVRLELGGDLRGRSILVTAGPGNNGGGGLAGARHLANSGASVEVILARPALRSTEAARHQLASLLAMGLPCCVAGWDVGDAELERTVGAADAVVDALLGYSIHGAPHGDVERLIRIVNGFGRLVISLDLPSGVDPDTGAVQGAAVRAAATVTLALPKPGLLRGAGAERAGRVYVGNLGLPPALFAELGIEPGPWFARGRLLRLDAGR
jgi:NAD(P)H-hydrate epimerase